MLDRITIKSWKGKDKTAIYEWTDKYTIVEHRKNKETGLVEELTKEIRVGNVRMLWDLLKRNLVQGEEYKYKYVVRKLCEQFRFHEEAGVPLELFLDAFNGGRNRTKYYFPFYYYPMKILEAKGFVQYLGRGGCILLLPEAEL